MRDPVLRCDIKAGEQSSRPEWLQTAYQFRRLFASLYDFAPSRFETTSRLPSPNVSPHSSPLRSLSPTRLFGGKKHTDGSEIVKGSRTGTGGGSPDLITQASGLATNTAMNLFALPPSGSAATASKEKLRMSPPDSQQRSSPPHSDPPSPGRKMSPDSPSMLSERRVVTPPIPESTSNSSSGKTNALWAAGSINGSGNGRDVLSAGYLYRVLSLSVSTQSKGTKCNLLLFRPAYLD